MTTHDPLGDGISALHLVDGMGDERRLASEIRISTGRDHLEATPEQDTKLLRSLMWRKEWGPFMLCQMKLYAVLPLPISNQWKRHWTWAYLADDDPLDAAYNELSRRYSSQDVQIYTPAVWYSQHPTDRQQAGQPIEGQQWAAEHYQDAVGAALAAYEALLALSVSREQARMVLPQGVYTRMYMSASLRSALHFIGLRADSKAETEIQAYARALQQIVAARWPLIWAAWVSTREAP